MNGSALRVRGNPAQNIGRRRHGGFRSACAGQPRLNIGAAQRWTVPLCVCGATAVQVHPALILLGSALRVRGNRGPRRERLHGRRFRSACAGQPGRGRWLPRCGQVPLCVCGATHPVEGCPVCERGSALRVRGNLMMPSTSPAYQRFRSACAGQPTSRSQGRPRCAVPLCVCGATCRT